MPAASRHVAGQWGPVEGRCAGPSGPSRLRKRAHRANPCALNARSLTRLRWPDRRLVGQAHTAPAPKKSNRWPPTPDRHLLLPPLSPPPMLALAWWAWWWYVIRTSPTFAFVLYTSSFQLTTKFFALLFFGCGNGLKTALLLKSNSGRYTPAEYEGTRRLYKPIYAPSSIHICHHCASWNIRDL